MQDNDNEIMRAIGRLEGKVDSLIVDIKEHTDMGINHEKRIANLEKKQYAIFLVGGIVGTAVLAFSKKIISLF